MNTDKTTRIVVGSIVVEDASCGIRIGTVHGNHRPDHVERADIEDLHKALGQYLARKSIANAKPPPPFGGWTFVDREDGVLVARSPNGTDVPIVWPAPDGESQSFADSVYVLHQSQRCTAWTKPGWRLWRDLVDRPEDGIRCIYAHGHEGRHRTADGATPTHAEYVAAIDRAAGSKREPVAAPPPAPADAAKVSQETREAAARAVDRMIKPLFTNGAVALFVRDGEVWGRDADGVDVQITNGPWIITRKREPARTAEVTLSSDPARPGVVNVESVKATGPDSCTVTGTVRSTPSLHFVPMDGTFNAGPSAPDRQLADAGIIERDGGFCWTDGTRSIRLTKGEWRPVSVEPDPYALPHPDTDALSALTRSLSEMLGCQDHPIAIQDRVCEICEKLNTPRHTPEASSMWAFAEMFRAVASELKCEPTMESAIERARALRVVEAKARDPILMLLWCPECGERHVDEGEFATKPHHTHACQNCGHVWRPAIGPTCGARFLPGFKNWVR